MRRLLPSRLAVAALLLSGACTNEVGCNGCNPPPPQWLAYRNNPGRYAQQFLSSALSNPTQVLASLHVGWKSPDSNWTGPTMPASFRGSPIVFNDTVFIGDIKGVFWALKAADGSFKWRFPATGAGLNGSCTAGGNGTWGAYGIQSSASYAGIGKKDAVIFGAPDPDPGTDGGNGSARLWALDADNGTLIWKSDVVARIPSCVGSIHERITYSSPLVAFDRVYVGVHDAGDDPVQKGRLVAVELSTGHLITAGFPFVVDGAPGDMTCGGVCGGGIWDSPSFDGHGIVFTTGNVCDWNVNGVGPCETEPAPDFSLSMVSLEPTTGALNWSFRAIPFARDSDPDWSAGPTSMLTTCGQLSVSVQKNGWTYALNAADGSCKWQFPPTAGPGCAFPATTTVNLYGDDDGQSLRRRRLQAAGRVVGQLPLHPDGRRGADGPQRRRQRVRPHSCAGCLSGGQQPRPLDLRHQSNPGVFDRRADRHERNGLRPDVERARGRDRRSFGGAAGRVHLFEHRLRAPLAHVVDRLPVGGLRHRSGPGVPGRGAGRQRGRRRSQDGGGDRSRQALRRDQRRPRLCVVAVRKGVT
jgi:outer membrane protein assembly factor BamB